MRTVRSQTDSPNTSGPRRRNGGLQLGDELCVCDLAWTCGASQNLASHHARVLRSAGLAASRREGKLVMYRLTDTGHSLLAAAALVTDGALTTSFGVEAAGPGLSDPRCHP